MPENKISLGDLLKYMSFEDVHLTHKYEEIELATIVELDDNTLTQSGKEHWEDVMNAKVNRIFVGGYGLQIECEDVEPERLAEFSHVLAGYCDADLYGGMFMKWLMSADPQPYNSYGNGSAMRVSPCGYIAESIEEALALAGASAEISHNHPEGIKGAEAVAAAIYMAKNGEQQDGIKRYVEEHYYKLDFSLNDIKQSYHFSETCQDTVPQAIQCFLKANSFEDTIRNAISIGGDSDTIACIAGSIAEAYFGIPDEMIEKVKTYLPKCFVDVVDRFYSVL